MVKSLNPASGSLIVQPSSAVSGSSNQFLGTGWTHSQTGKLQLLPNPLPAVQIDMALFVVGDLQVVPQIDMSPDVYNQHLCAFLNTMTHEGEVGDLIPLTVIQQIQFKDFLQGMKKLWGICGFSRMVAKVH